MTQELDFGRPSDVMLRPPAPQSESAALMQAIMQASSNPAVDADKMERMLKMMREIRKDEAEAAFNQALSALHSRVPKISKDGRVRYKDTDFGFATYERIMEVVQPILADLGLSIVHDSVEATSGKTTYIATMTHKLGHSLKSQVTFPADTSGGKNAIQAIVSAGSYGKRHTTKALCGIVEEGEDNDGNLVGTIEEREVNKLIDLCAACDEFKPATDKDTTEDQVKRKYKVKAFSDIPRKQYAGIVTALNERHKALRLGAPWKAESK